MGFPRAPPLGAYPGFYGGSSWQHPHRRCGRGGADSPAGSLAQGIGWKSWASSPKLPFQPMLRLALPVRPAKPTASSLMLFPCSRVDGFGGHLQHSRSHGKDGHAAVPGSPALGMGRRGRQNGPKQGGFTGKLLCYGMPRAQSVCGDYCYLRN